MNTHQEILLKNINKHKVLVNTVPHCGTHLVSSILDTIGYKHATYRKYGLFRRKVGLNWRLSETFMNISPEKYDNSVLVSVASPKLVRFEIVEKSLNKINFGEYALSHIPFNKKFSNYLINHNWKGFFIIRDPRDMCLSMLRHIESRPNHFAHSYLFTKINSKSERIKAIVRGFTNEKNREFIGINKMYLSMLEWKNSSNFAFLKYEELVGEKGNGKVIPIKFNKKIFNNLEYSEIHLGNKLFEFVGNSPMENQALLEKAKLAIGRKLFQRVILIFLKNI